MVKSGLLDSRDVMYDLSSASYTSTKSVEFQRVATALSTEFRRSIAFPSQNAFCHGRVVETSGSTHIGLATERVLWPSRSSLLEAPVEAWPAVLEYAYVDGAIDVRQGVEK